SEKERHHGGYVKQGAEPADPEERRRTSGLAPEPVGASNDQKQVDQAPDGSRPPVRENCERQHQGNDPGGVPHPDRTFVEPARFEMNGEKVCRTIRVSSAQEDASGSPVLDEVVERDRTGPRGCAENVQMPDSKTRYQQPQDHAVAPSGPSPV